ncbi:hypothetical protein J7K42_02150 [bacterium]|nr:hypothetical protein [bacterium]
MTKGMIGLAVGLAVVVAVGAFYISSLQKEVERWKGKVEILETARIELENEVVKIKNEAGVLRGELYTLKAQESFFQLCETRFESSYEEDGKHAWARRFGYGTGFYRGNPFKWFLYCNSDGNLLMNLSVGIDQEAADRLEAKGLQTWSPESYYVRAIVELGNDWIGKEPLKKPVEILMDTLDRLENTKLFSHVRVEKVYPFNGKW